MVSIGSFYRPLNIVAVISDGSAFGPGLMSALSGHYSLLCRTESQARDAVDQYAVDLVLLEYPTCCLADHNDQSESSIRLAAVTPEEFRTASASRCPRSLLLPASYDEARRFLHDSAAAAQSRVELLRNSA